jgi:hypothetical protein
VTTERDNERDEVEGRRKKKKKRERWGYGGHRSEQPQRDKKKIEEG